MPPGGWARRRGRRPGARRSHARPRAAAVRAREAPSGAPRVARRGPAADNALPRATSRAAARQTPARRPPPRAGPSAPRPAPPGFPLVCQGAVRAQRRPPPSSALPAPPSLLPRSSRGSPRPLFGFTAPNFCLAPYWFFSTAQSNGRAPPAPASCYSRPRRQGPRRDAAVGLPRELSETRPSCSSQS